MEVNSPTVSLNGQNGPKDLGEYRERAIENATRQQFYQSDRVKQFHRELLLMETLNDRRLQMERNRRIKDNSDEETRKFMAEIRRLEKEAAEQDRRKARRLEKDKAAYGEDLREQMREMEQMRQRRRLDKEREKRECDELFERYEQEKLELKRRQHQEKMEVRRTYMGQMAKSCSDRARAARDEAAAEERRQRRVQQKDEWARANDEKQAERLRRRQRRSETAAERLAAQHRERDRRYDASDSKATAAAVAKQEARLAQERNRKHRMDLDMAKAIGDHRDYKRRERQLRVDAERLDSLETLGAYKQADSAYGEAQRRAARTQRDSRAAMDEALRQQMAQKRLQQNLLKQAEMDLDAKNLELLSHEDAQFQRYAKGIITVAEGTRRNTIPIRKAANMGTGQGVGPIYGGLRAKYLVPGSKYLPEYVKSTSKDINRLYKTPADESSHGKLGFIW